LRGAVRKKPKKGVWSMERLAKVGREKDGGEWEEKIQNKD
jgi:hypothetical protein